MNEAFRRDATLCGMNRFVSRRQALVGAASIAAAAAGICIPARAASKVRFLTSWFAQAEHGGYYQAKATGLYEKAGLDVEIKMGGPQVNGLQLLTGGDADLAMGYDLTTLTAIEKGLPVTTVATSFQFDLQGILAHAGAKSLSDLKGHKVLIASSSHLSFWPWLKERFGYTDDMAGAYTFNLQPFFTDTTLAQQAYATSEPFQCEQNKVAYKFFLFADEGYPPYGSTMTTTRPFLEKNPDVVARFVRATAEGWRSYLQNPTPGNGLIKVDNPKMSDEQLAFSVARLKAIKAISGGDAASAGIGTITEARYKKTRDFMVRNGLVKDATDWKLAFTTDFVKSTHVVA